MSRTPFVQVDEPAGPVRALALVLHGGRSKSRAEVRANHLAVLRMIPFARRLRDAGRDHGLAVARMRYLVRGWNGADASPVADVQGVLDQLAQRYPDVPIAMVGHSMGGRAAIYTAGHPAVQVVVGLAPWLEPGDPITPLAGRRLLVAHGDQDRMTDPSESAQFTRAAAAVATSAAYVTVTGERHPMLRRARVWHELTAGYVLGALCDCTPGGTVSDSLTNLVEKALAGEPTMVI